MVNFRLAACVTLVSGGKTVRERERVCNIMFFFARFSATQVGLVSFLALDLTLHDLSALEWHNGGRRGTWQSER